MLDTAPLLTFQLQAQTNNAAPNTWTTGNALGTVSNISIYGDGKVTFTGSDGVVRQYSGNDSKINALLQMLLNAPGGLTDATAFFGNA